MADIGIPMLFVQLPTMLVALVPVIVVEAVLMRRWLKLSYREVFGAATLANVTSTLLGVPLAWGIALAVEFASFMPLSFAAFHWHWHWFDNSVVALLAQCTLGIAWLTPAEEELRWMIPVAAAGLLVPSFFVSVWIERSICRKRLREVDEAAVNDCVKRANLVSYAGLFAVAVAVAIVGAVRH
jgi:hypothetical protein